MRAHPARPYSEEPRGSTEHSLTTTVLAGPLAVHAGAGLGGGGTAKRMTGSPGTIHTPFSLSLSLGSLPPSPPQGAEGAQTQACRSQLCKTHPLLTVPEML